MSDIYLSRIQIQDFRTFGHFDVEIPPEPGVVLLSGTNGLGKSSFFDAIEWGLTGKIRRFTPYILKGKYLESDYLTRRGAEPGSHEVRLTYSDGALIERSAAGGTPMSAIIELLAQADRPAINDLGTYLALTHFLGQASEQRFTSRESQDQWQALKGPSGIERLELVRSGLRGRSTTTAFTRRIEDEQTVIASIERKIAEWQGLEARRDRLRQAAHAAGTLTTEELAQRATALESELFSLLKEHSPAIVGESASQRLGRVGERIEQAIQEFIEKEATLEGMAGAVAQFIFASTNARTDHPVLTRARQEVDNARSNLSTATAVCQSADAALTAQKTVIVTIEHEISILEAARSDLSERGQLAPQIAQADAEVSRLSAIVAERGAARAAAKAAVRKHADAVAEVARLRSIWQRAVALVDANTTLLNLEAIVSKNAADLESARQAASVAQLELEPLKAKSDILSQQLKLLVAAQAEAERHASQISAAVAAVASHVHDDDTVCPVCRTPFQPGQLKLLAEEAARSKDARLADMAAEIEKQRSEAASAGVRIAELNAVINAPLQLEKIWEASGKTAATARAALIRDLGSEHNADLGALSNNRMQEARKELAQAELGEESLASHAAAAGKQIAAIDAELDDLTGRETAARTQLNELRAADQSSAERTIARGMAGVSLESLGTRIAEQRTSLEAARTQLAQLADKANTAKTQLDGCRVTLAAAERASAEIESERSNSEAAARQIAQRWNRGGLDGLPNQATLDASLAEVRERATAVRLFSDRQHELARENQDLLRQQEIDEVIEAMRAAGGDEALSDPLAYLSGLRAKESAARVSLKLTKEARKAVSGFTELLKERAEGFSTRVLAPLNNVINDFNDAMLSTPGESIQFKAEHRVDTTSFGMSLRYRQQIEEVIERQKGLPPQIVLSEGQLAANGFSILCAASIAYPWSRWRSLLLDDPLQHNDIIHTAAFVDLMRNMVERQGYQLIMSSHDRAESSYIARKFDAAGIACSQIELTAPSSTGVIHQGPEYNSRAKQAMRDRTTKTQFSQASA